MRGLASFAGLLILAGPAMAVRYEQPREEVLQELGKPTSSITRSGREVLLYPNGVRIELEGGKVVLLQGIEPADAEAPAATGPEPAAAPPAPPAAEEEPDEAMAEEKLTPEQQKALEAAEKELAAQDAKARAEMEKAIGELEKVYEGGADEPPPPRFNPLAFVFEVFIAWALMVAALKITTKYWAVDIEWSGLLIAAAADTVVKVVVRLIGVLVLEMPMLFYADEAIAAVVLVLVLRKVSTNQKLEQAVTVTLTSKLFSVIVGSFLAMVLMKALF